MGSRVAPPVVQALPAFYMDEQVKYLIFVPLAAVIGASYLVSVPVNAGNEAPKVQAENEPTVLFSRTRTVTLTPRVVASVCETGVCQPVRQLRSVVVDRVRSRPRILGRLFQRRSAGCGG